MRFIISIALFAAVLMPVSAQSHSGGLDSNGCHGGSEPYHCHRSASDMVRTETGHNRLRCDLGSRSQECTGDYEDSYDYDYDYDEYEYEW